MDNELKRILYINDLKDCEAARRLVGKSVLCSNSLDGIINGVGTIGKLEEINARNCSFKVNDYGETYYCRFIKYEGSDTKNGQ